MSTLTIMLIFGLASGRIAFSITQDEIFRPLREAIWLRSAPESGNIVVEKDDGELAAYPARMFHDGEFRPADTMRHPGFFGKLSECVYCMSFWTSLPFVIGWQLAPTDTLMIATPFAVWSIANIIAVKGL